MTITLQPQRNLTIQVKVSIGDSILGTALGAKG